MTAIRFLIRGRVQGVGYRAFARGVALRLGLRGTVRNLLDGSVESIVNGPEEAVEAYARALAEGPRFSSVSSVERSETSLEHELPSPFQITA